MLFDRQCGKGSFVGGDEDRISRLPGGILVDIIYLLSLKEAGRTSILSPRWKNLWKHTPSLDFNSQSAFRPNPKKLVNWVDSVIKSHTSPTLKDFRIGFPLDRSFGDSITRWLEFAFSREVEMLELNLEAYPFRYCWYEYYRFPKELSAPSNTLFVFSCLRGLGFKCVNMRGGAIE
ncbi:PREDICTED: putative F-box/LRR-repeat protein At4g15060 [Erythranthe guttata]|uniref:putative F-box/LRR-repeat protein At4g15060 n=1 Tax=Erythranthe guttata TaxID=4155 RepID=UPI00064DA1F7|nr:PREDICTED: putative F-box/LRR-repeat protein At4g15060 [Erythranthe guttata]|eukprot:XP_012833057.1 PREDICTED: putative F-box/LRR-repeat protein At4g15060 [Erythranthe guttata]